MGWTDIISTIGKGAIGMLPGGGLAVTALEGISKIADIVGGKDGDKISNGVKEITEGLKSIEKTPMSPDLQVKMADNKNEYEIKMKEIALEEKSLIYQDQAGGREIVKTALNSDDPLVRQARPKMMIKLGTAAIIYSFVSPFIVFSAGFAGFSDKIVTILIDVLTYQGGMLWTSFTLSFGGYTAARTLDKRALSGKKQTSVLESVSKIGKMIS